MGQYPEFKYLGKCSKVSVERCLRSKPDKKGAILKFPWLKWEEAGLESYLYDTPSRAPFVV